MATAENNRMHLIDMSAFMISIVLFAFLLIGCSGASPAADSTETSSAYQTSSDTATFLIDPALDTTYQKALAAAQTKAADVKLIAIRNATSVYPDTSFEWMYLFASAQNQESYTVFISGDNAIAADYGAYTIDNGSFDQIPSADNIIYDADIAFSQVVKSLPAGTKIEDINIYLMTYVLEDENPTAEAMKWFFEFNSGDTATNTTSTTVTTTSYSSTSATPSEIQGSTSSASSEHAGFVYMVDAKTGETWKIE